MVIGSDRGGGIRYDLLGNEGGSMSKSAKQLTAEWEARQKAGGKIPLKVWIYAEDKDTVKGFARILTRKRETNATRSEN